MMRFLMLALAIVCCALVAPSPAAQPQRMHAWIDGQEYVIVGIIEGKVCENGVCKPAVARSAQTGCVNCQCKYPGECGSPVCDAKGACEVQRAGNCANGSCGVAASGGGSCASGACGVAPVRRAVGFFRERQPVRNVGRAILERRPVRRMFGRLFCRGC